MQAQVLQQRVCVAGVALQVEEKEVWAKSKMSIDCPEALLTNTCRDDLGCKSAFLPAILMCVGKTISRRERKERQQSAEFTR